MSSLFSHPLSPKMNGPERRKHPVSVNRPCWCQTTEENCQNEKGTQITRRPHKFYSCQLRTEDGKHMSWSNESLMMISAVTFIATWTWVRNSGEPGTNARREWRVVCVVPSNRKATVAQTAKKMLVMLVLKESIRCGASQFVLGGG